MSLDIGERRIGVARGDTVVRIAFPVATIAVDGEEISHIAALIQEIGASKIVIGYPRNQSGGETKQTAYVREFAQKLQGLSVEIVYQDESLTSVMAEDRLKAQKKPYSKESIDAEAAAIILSDYLEAAI